MLTRNECLEAAADCLAHAKSIYIRNGARCLADFARVTFTEIGSYYSGYQIVRDMPITKRFRLLSSVIPEILPFEKMFKDIEEIRNKVDHHDHYTPGNEELTGLVNRAKEFQVVFESKVIPKLSGLGKTPKEKLSEEWKIMPPMIETLKRYQGWGSADYDSLKDEIEYIQSIVSRIDEVNDEATQEVRIKLRDLQIKITGQLESAEADMAFEAAQR